jgi:hypothetical protein
MFIMLENILFPLDPSLTPLIVSRISNHPCLRNHPLNTKTRPMLCRTLQILLFAFNPNPLYTSHTQSRNLSFKIMITSFC